MNEPSSNSTPSTGAEAPRRSLARRLLAWVLIISAANALLAISVQLYLDYKRDLADLEEHLSFVGQSQSQGLAAAAWNFDRPLVEAQLSGLTGSPWVAGAEVLYGRNEEVRVALGQRVDGSRDVMTYPLAFDVGPRTVQLGHLRVLPDMALIYQRTLDRGLVVALTQGFKTLVLSVALLLLVHHLVSRRLTRLNTLLRAYRPGPGAPLQLMTPGERQAGDELSTLASTLEQAQERLEEYHRKEVELREQLEDEVQRRTRFLDQALLEQQAIFDNSLTGIAFIRDRTILRCNTSFEQMFGYANRELTGRSTRLLFPSQHAFEQEATFFIPVLLCGGTYIGDAELVKKDGSTRWFTIQLKSMDVDDPNQGAVLTLHDITVRRDAERTLERLARLDGLTGIANRRTLDEALLTACRKASRDKSALSLALLDVDFFKPFNDHYGHAAGDEALVAVARALQESTRRPYDLAARYGGEEFVLLLPGCEDPGPLLEKLRQAVIGLNIPHSRSETSKVLTVSIGAISICGSDRCDPSELLNLADEQLYQAKHHGRNRVAWRALQPVEG